MSPLVNLPLTEAFDDTNGEFVNYHAYDLTQRNQLLLQKHTDVRVFQQGDVTIPYRMLDLDGFSMTLADSITMNQLEGTTLATGGEHWTTGAVAPITDHNHLRGLVLSCVAGTNTTSSFIPTRAGGVETVDITTGYASSDFLSVALPN